LYFHAGAFVLPSSHEGLPIALLEALSYGLPVVASNIPANLELGLPESCYFPVGDIQALGKRLTEVAQRHDDADARERRRRWVRERYDWDRVALKTLAVYQDVMHDRPAPR
jgi:glycosyltransferase involved in cell wall biosynthesis